LHILWNNSKTEEDDDLKSSTSTLHADYNGKYYQLEKISVAPKPFQKPHPPIFIGAGGSSEAGLRRAAKYGDGWMASAYNITPDKFREKWNILLSYRKRLGRDSESFENSVMSMFGYIDNDKDKVHTLVKEVILVLVVNHVLGQFDLGKIREQEDGGGKLLPRKNVDYIGILRNIPKNR
jgi:alkanesulfonate monooxygenase SsuD/methylene tetrahydromethanopterin reductase-like flavin-dependent oxidoreductase (luciferase family)